MDVSSSGVAVWERSRECYTPNLESVGTTIIQSPYNDILRLSSFVLLLAYFQYRCYRIKGYVKGIEGS